MGNIGKIITLFYGAIMGGDEMRRAITCLAVSGIVAIAGVSAGAATAGDTSVARPQTQMEFNFAIEAPPSDFPAFRALNVPDRMMDTVLAELAHDRLVQVRDHPETKAGDAVIGPVYAQVLRETGDIWIDAVMHRAFTRFDHYEVTRLTEICTRPTLARLQTRQIEMLQSGVDMSEAAYMDTLEADPDFKSMARADQRLLSRFIRSIAWASGQQGDLQKQFIGVMEARLRHAPEPAIIPPTPPLTVAPDPPLAHDEALYMNEISWIIPWSVMPDFGDLKTEGRMVLDCGANTDGTLSKCEVVANSWSPHALDKLATDFAAGVKAHPDILKAGIPAGARLRFSAHIWQKDASSHAQGG